MRTVAGFLHPALDKTACSSGHRRNPESLGGQGWNRNPQGTVGGTGETQPGRDAGAVLRSGKDGVCGMGFSLFCLARRTGRWVAVTGRLIVAHGKEALSRSSHCPQVDSESWATGGIQGKLDVGLGKKEQCHPSEQLDRAFKRPSNICVLHI